jgi:hypothetical protein
MLLLPLFWDASLACSVAGYPTFACWDMAGGGCSCSLAMVIVPCVIIGSWLLGSGIALVICCFVPGCPWYRGCRRWRRHEVEDRHETEGK